MNEIQLLGGVRERTIVDQARVFLGLIFEVEIVLPSLFDEKVIIISVHIYGFIRVQLRVPLEHQFFRMKLNPGKREYFVLDAGDERVVLVRRDGRYGPVVRQF